MKKIIVAVLLTVLIITSVISCQNQQQPNSSGKKEAKSDPVKELLEGNKRFLEEKSNHPHQDKKSVLANQDAQKPFAVVVTCSDSRVSPEIVFDQGIGDLFVIRNAGNLISDIDMGSIEYAIEHLDTKLVIILGHTECGAIKAYIKDNNGAYKKHFNHIDNIVETIANEKEEIEADKVSPKANNYLGAINANILHSVKMVQDNPIAKEHKVKIIPMRYDIHTGNIVQL